MEYFIRSLLGFLAFLAIIIFLIVLIFRLAGRNNGPAEPVNNTQLVELVDRASFVFTEKGPIVADEEHYQIRITVNDISRRVELVQGYEGKVVAQANYDNNPEAFRQFLSALERAGYNRDRSTDFQNEDGLCPTGRRYVFETSPEDALTRRWATSCRERGNLGADANILRELYRKQIPDYSKFISDGRRATGLII